MSWPVILIIAGLVFVIGGVILIYNSLVKARNRVFQSESDIDVQFKRRWDLIPNLIESVKGYVKHERETLDSIVSARSAAMQASPHTAEAHQAENMLTGALKSLFALAENYPDLKASQNFLQLQGELVDTEDKIQAARRLYNNTLRDYMDKLQLFPNNMIAGMFGFKVQHQFFEAEEAATEPVKVQF